MYLTMAGVCGTDMITKTTENIANLLPSNKKQPWTTQNAIPHGTSKITWGCFRTRALSAASSTEKECSPRAGVVRCGKKCTAPCVEYYFILSREKKEETVGKKWQNSPPRASNDHNVHGETRKSRRPRMPCRGKRRGAGVRHKFCRSVSPWGRQP